MKPIKILIADDHLLMRDMLVYMLASDSRFQVIAACGDSQEAIALTEEKKPDIVLMDINILPYSGIEATEKICTSTSSSVIGMSVHTNPFYVKKMFKMGARGYITKNSSKEEMLAAIVAVSGGKKYICEEIKNMFLMDAPDWRNDAKKFTRLTKRETEITRQVKEGLSSKDIASTLTISQRTVEVHRHNILKKLRLSESPALTNPASTYTELKIY